MSSEKVIAINYGKLALGIRKRLSEFAVALNLGEISTNPPPLRHKLEGRNLWAVSISKNFRIIFQTGDGDPGQIKSIIIADVCDYH